MKDNRIFLKVKLKSLAAESRIIRRETRKAPVALKNALALHRRDTVRSAARNTHLAYCFLRGREYSQVEHKCDSPPNWSEVARMVKQYGIRWDGTVSFADYEVAKASEAARLKQWMSCPAMMA